MPARKHSNKPVPHEFSESCWPEAHPRTPKHKRSRPVGQPQKTHSGTTVCSGFFHASSQCAIKKNSVTCSKKRSGMPNTKYHFCVLCRNMSIPVQTPRLPKQLARKKSTPSDILPAPPLRLRHLSRAITKKTLTFIHKERTAIIKSNGVIPQKIQCLNTIVFASYTSSRLISIQKNITLERR